MSKWTHVAGIVRYDMFSIGRPVTEPEFYAYKWSDSERARDKCNVPCGSEGSLTVNKHDVYRTDNQAFVTYAFSGDLRDYSYEDDHEELEKWIQSLIPDSKTNPVMIRQAVFQVDYEDRDGTVIYQYDNELNKFVAGELNG